MEDSAIITMYFERSEKAISETKNKYGKMLVSIAMHILKSLEDSEECENDTYLKAWNTIPPQKPNVLSAFLGKITRNLALDRYDKMTSEKRGKGEVSVLIDELAEVIPDNSNNNKNFEFLEIINSFLDKQPRDIQNIFVRRYWYGYSIKEIAKDYGFSESKVKMSLSRLRELLKKTIEKEGICI